LKLLTRTTHDEWSEAVDSTDSTISELHVLWGSFISDVPKQESYK